MSVVKPDIAELYGLPPLDAEVAARLVNRKCPFINSTCTSIVQGSSNPTGVCSVTQGATRTPVVVCENRLYGDDYAVLRMISIEAFGVANFIVGGDIDDLEDKLVGGKAEAVVAIGPDSGDSIQVMGRSKVKFDWILQHYTQRRKRLGFAAIEVHTVEVGGNFRDCRDAYKDHHAGRKVTVPASEHTLAWSNLTKKFIPELIAKALVVSQTPDAKGFFVVLPDVVYQRFADIFEDVPEQSTTGADIVSFRTYSPDNRTASGVRGGRAANYLLRDVIAAHYARPDEKAIRQLAKTLKEVLQ